MRRAAVTALLVAFTAGCEGVTLEILEPALPDGGVGAPGVVLWEIRLALVEGAGCPAPSELAPGAVVARLPAGRAPMPIESVPLERGRRQRIAAIGRDDACRALFYGQTCIGPDPPARVVSITTCDVTAARCADLALTAEDREALRVCE